MNDEWTHGGTGGEVEPDQRSCEKIGGRRGSRPSRMGHWGQVICGRSRELTLHKLRHFVAHTYDIMSSCGFINVTQGAIKRGIFFSYLIHFNRLEQYMDNVFQ